MINRIVAKIFNDMADLLEVQGENPFRIRAYRRAAMNIESVSRDLAGLSAEDLQKIPGIGRDLAQKIREYADTGKIEAWEALKKEVPEGLIEIISVPGVGPKTAKLLFDKLGIANLEDLDRAAREGRLRDVPHIREKTEKNILKGLDIIRRGRERMPLGRALPIAEEIVDFLKRTAPVKDIEVAGSLRRRKETVKDIDILVTSGDPEKVMDLFVSMSHVQDVIARGQTKSSVRLDDGIQVDLRVVDRSCFGAALQYFTGSKEHNVRIREMAARKGLKISEYGIFDAKNGKFLGGGKEKDIYEILGMQYVEPELREDAGEIEAALKGTLPSLIELKDIRGDLHVHSDWSDGGHSIEEIALEAKKRGFSYIALTDHSKGLGIAGGLTEERVLQQIREIDEVNSRLDGFRVLKGIEVDIRSDFTLDLPDEILRRLDIVVASIHSGFRQSREQLTRRMLSAVRNPHVSVIAHPTGRLIGERDPYEIDMEAVLKAARETNTAIEINAHPARLDMNDTTAREAAAMGVPIVISTDTHYAEQYDYMKYGIAVARRAWLEKGAVVNAGNYSRLKKFLMIKRTRLFSGDSRA